MRRLFTILIAIFVPLFILLAGFTAKSKGAAAAIQSIHLAPIDFTPDEATERANISDALSMDREDVLSELRGLYLQWREEEQWGAFIESMRLYLRVSNMESFGRWNEAYSLASSRLWVNSNMIGSGTKKRLLAEKTTTTSLQVDLATLRTMLPIIRDARVQITKSIMIEVFGNEEKGMFLDAWDEVDFLKDQDANP